jgi:hypothetical protein
MTIPVPPSETMEAPANDLGSRFPNIVSADTRPNFKGWIVLQENLVEVATAIRDEFGYDLLGVNSATLTSLGVPNARPATRRATYPAPRAAGRRSSIASRAPSRTPANERSHPPTVSQPSLRYGSRHVAR